MGGVRVGMMDGQLIANPTIRRDTKKRALNIVVAGTENAIVMVEAGAQEVSEEAVLGRIEFGHAQMQEDRRRRSSELRRQGQARRK